MFDRAQSACPALGGAGTLKGLETRVESAWLVSALAPAPLSPQVLNHQL